MSCKTLNIRRRFGLAVMDKRTEKLTMLFSLQKCSRYNSAMVETVLHLRKERTALSSSNSCILRNARPLHVSYNSSQIQAQSQSS